MSAFVRVIVDCSIRRELDYSVPAALCDKVVVGARVRVPFRDKSLLGTVVATLDESPAEGIKPVVALLGEKPVLSASLIELARWMANYYCCPVETVMRSLLPQVIRRAEVGWKKQLFVGPARIPTQEEIEKLRKRAPRQAELLEAIAQLREPIPAADLLRQTSLDNSTLRALVRRGFAELREQAVERDPHGTEEFVADAELVMNEEQTAALKLIQTALEEPETHPPILLYGVTGSGKTEVYLQAIQYAMDKGKGAIVLVPEISLTPQTLERFRGRFASDWSPFCTAVWAKASGTTSGIAFTRARRGS